MGGYGLPGTEAEIHCVCSKGGKGTGYSLPSFLDAHPFPAPNLPAWRGRDVARYPCLLRTNSVKLLLGTLRYTCEACPLPKANSFGKPKSDQVPR